MQQTKQCVIICTFVSFVYARISSHCVRDPVLFSVGYESFHTMKMLCVHAQIGSSTLPRATTRATETDGVRGDKVTAATSSTSLYDNVAGGNQNSQANVQGKSESFNLVSSDRPGAIMEIASLD